MSRIACYIDGFNLYHGIKEHSKTRIYRWVDLWSLTASFVVAADTLSSVKYYTSLPPWSQAKQRRHETYIAALESKGIKTVRGRFQRDEKICGGSCKELFLTYTEKLTDVHIATSLLVDGFRDEFDIAYLMSGDADLAPAIQALKIIAPDKKVKVLFPPRRHSTELEQVAWRSDPIGWKKIRDHQLPDTITIGNRTIQRPNEWALPAL